MQWATPEGAALAQCLAPDLAQRTEHNRGRVEARMVGRFAVEATQVGFPFVQQAAFAQQALEDPSQPNVSFKEVFLLTTLAPEVCDAGTLLEDKRGYWGIEAGLHQRLDVIALEDKSRVRTLNAAWNLAMFRRLSISLAIHWIRRQRRAHSATLSGFYDAMKAQRCRRAFNLLTAVHPNWLPAP